VAVAALVLCAWAAAAFAQPPGCVPYRNGKKAIDAGQWAQAVTELKKAEQADPNPTDAKTCEGNLSNPYYPQYYLTVAYFNLQDFQNASLYLNQAKTRKKGFPAKDAKEIDRYTREIEVGLHPRPNDFNTTLARAEAALRPGACAGAVKDFTDAKGISPYWFDKEGKGARLSMAEKCVQSDQLYADAKSLVDRGQLGLAQQRASAAIAAYPDASAATALLGDIQTRNRTFDEQKRTAEQSAGAGRLADAKTAYTRARSANAERFASENLDGRVTDIDRRIKDEEVRLLGEEKAKARQARVSNALASAREAFTGGRYADVNARLKPVFDEDPSNADARDLKSRADSRLLLADGRALENKRNYKDAEAKFQAAFTADATNSDASAALDTSRKFADLERRGRQLAGSRNPQAREVLVEAQNLDRARFQRENLAGVLASVPQPVAPLPPPPPPPPKPAPVPEPVAKPATTPAPAATTPAPLAQRAAPVNAALQRLFTGEVSAAITDLETVVAAGSADRGTLAIAHAYLGVAHATLALSAADDSAASRREKALAEFREARKLKTDLTLSTKLVSPRIRELFDQSRAR